MTKKEPSKFVEVISMSVPNFYDFNYDVEEFCGYLDTGNTCPFILMDAKEDRQHKHIANFDPQNCMYLCRWFIKQDLPLQAKTTNRLEKR